MKTVRFGVIGLGLMGREFASAAARWFHLSEMDVRPEIVAICSRNPSPEKTSWFTGNLPSIRQVTNDMGHEVTYKSITGGIFEFGFSDAVLQMWAAFLHELVKGVARSHRLFTAALESHAESNTVGVD